jgi:hypothetical protein
MKPITRQSRACNARSGGGEWRLAHGEQTREGRARATHSWVTCVSCHSSLGILEVSELDCTALRMHEVSPGQGLSKQPREYYKRRVYLHVRTGSYS